MATSMSKAEISAIKSRNHELGVNIQNYLRLGAKYRELHRDEYFSWRNELIQINRPLIESRARLMVKKRGYIDNGSDFYLEEMITISGAGAWRATQDFDPKKAEFSTYHCKCAESARQVYFAFKIRRLGSIPHNISSKCRKIDNAEGTLILELEREPTSRELADFLYRKQVRKYLVDENKREFEDGEVDKIQEPTEEEIDAVIKEDAEKKKKKEKRVCQEIQPYDIYWLRTTRHDADPEYRGKDRRGVYTTVVDRELDPASQAVHNDQLESLIAIRDDGILTSREKQVLKNRFGNCPSSLQELAKSLGVSRERVRQIETEALVKLALRQRPELVEELDDDSFELFSLLLGWEDKGPMSLSNSGKVLGIPYLDVSKRYIAGVRAIRPYISSSAEILKRKRSV